MAYETGRPTNADPSAVSSRDEFADFVHATLDDFQQAGRTEWENHTVERLLEALAAVSYARAWGEADPETPTWGLFARLVFEATAYE